MPNRILTSHAGSLPRPESLISLNELRAAGEFTDEETYRGEIGIDLVNDGEYGHSMGIEI